ncbi:MAG: carboxypeptidase-like regulatory domain-containing protein, partial [Bacteroidetes bacterium]|nr:carboxypeptidase-like regulatory domain-containing protein [Bacteroidota bacterium]
MYRKFLFLALCIAFNLSMFAQQPPSGISLGNNKSIVVNGKIKGRIYDAKDKSFLSYVSVVLLGMSNDSVIAGNISDENGYFLISDVPLGLYRLKAKAAGYDSLLKIIKVDMSNLELEVGNLYLNPSALLLKSVTVSAGKSQIELKPDKKVINVDKDISAKGGTAVDVLKNAPGVTVNADDEITLRNNTPTIYVDGKPTNLTMRQIPADQINTIEIITNPSSKYEASATGGIINITLKKNNKPGYNGMFNVGIGTNSQYSGMGMFNIKEKKWGANLSYNYNSNITTAPGISNRDNFLNGIYNGGSYQDITTKFDRQMQFGRFGFDYFINNRNTISINQNLMFGKMGFTENQNTEQLGIDHSLLASSKRSNLQQINISNYSTTLSFKHSYPKPGKEYTADFT